MWQVTRLTLPIHACEPVRTNIDAFKRDEGTGDGTVGRLNLLVFTVLALYGDQIHGQWS